MVNWLTLLIVFLSFASVLSLSTRLSLSRQPSKPIGIGDNKKQASYFTGAGIYFWWQLGAAKYLRENCDVNDIGSHPVIGASAGTITASMLLSGADFDKLPEEAVKLANEYKLFERSLGLFGIWGSLLRNWLDICLPTEFNSADFVNFYAAVTPVLGVPKLVNGFSNREELIEVILASCHIPLFLDGRVYTEYRGERLFDGSFWYFVTKDRLLGLPLLQDVGKESIFWVDYSDDEDFMLATNGNILELISEDRMYDMIDAGYNYMKRLHYHHELPFAKNVEPNFVRFALQGDSSDVGRIGMSISRIAARIRLQRLFV